MEVVVAGENIDPAELNQGGWTDIRRRQRTYLDARNGSLQVPTSNNQQINRDARNRSARRNPPASPLPETDIKIVLRPRGGLDLRSVAQASLADAIFQKANLPQNPVDQIRVQHVANYLLISTPSEERAQKYSAIQSLAFKGQQYEVVAHVSAPANTAT